VGLKGRRKRRWRKSTVPDSAIEWALEMIERDFGQCHELDRRYVGDIERHEALSNRAVMKGHRLEAVAAA
jgi:hypothetical protein